MSPSPALQALPLPAETVDAFTHLARDLDQAGLWWLSGYAAGLAAASGSVRPSSATAPRQEATAAGRLTVVYGSQTGNARRAAERIAADAESAGLAVRLLRADAYPQRELKTEQHLYLVVSTQGDGEPPDDARDLVEFLLGPRAPKLTQLHYAVLALGDSSYPQFCAVGRQIDERLAALGATRLLERGEADLDIETVADPWRSRAIATAQHALKPAATVTPLRPVKAVSPAFDRDTPFQAELLTNQRITLGGAGSSNKDVRHIELSLEDAGLTYQPGDALGVHVRNAPERVDAILALTRLDGDTPVALAGKERPLREWLGGHRELSRLLRPFAAAHAQRSGDDSLRTLLEPAHADAFTRWSEQRQIIDLLQEIPAQWDAAALVAALRPLVPRLYSIASSQKEVGDEVHLTLAHAHWEHNGQARWGTASHALANAQPGERLPVYIEANERFRLPADASRDIIMIGPGTGVAPFRAFVQERAASGASGRNWLFFGNPHFSSDFLYQMEWQRALRDGTLHRIDLAFSRDVPRRLAPPRNAPAAARTYVQHRIAERGRDLLDWIDNGAHLYVCGAVAMGRDVHAALIDAIAAHSGADRDAASGCLDELTRQGRYARDVY